MPAQHEPVLTVAITGGWGTVHPALQHSAYGDSVLTNQFEPLLRTGRNGVIEPLAAQEWTISPDRRVYRFRIDRARRFSDGSPLTAADFKRSWEEGLKMRPISSNFAGLDVLGSVRGFSERGPDGRISGLRAPSDDLLEVEFSSPARMVLEHLCGVRFAAFKDSKGRPIGTGTHVLIGQGKSLTLRPNPFHAGTPPPLREMRLIEIAPEDVGPFIRSGKADAALFASTIHLSPHDDGTIGLLYGQEANHVMVGVNGLPGRILADGRLRRALQALLWKRLRQGGIPRALSANHFSPDPQSLLAFQAGRLADRAAIDLVDSGTEAVTLLVDRTRQRPLRVVSSRDVSWLIDWLREEGISVSKDSGRVSFDDILAIIYKTHAADLLLGSFTVDNGDPDGLYHILGRDGAIHSPMMSRPSLERLMAAGRSILDPQGLDTHYQSVSREILREVPYIHLGYSHETIAFARRRVKVSESFASRNNSRVTIFQPR